jgi:hypothetical protein
MEELNKNYNIKNIEIKRDNMKKDKILSIIDSKETLEINLNNSNLLINTNSIKKIYSLSNLKIEENIFYIYKNNAYYQNEPSNNQNLNEIGTSYGKGNLPQSKEYESEPLIRKIDFYLPYIYSIIGSILLIHLFTFLFGPQFEINVYVFTCLILSEDLLSLGYFYYEKYHFIESYNIHQYYIPYFLIVSCLLCFCNILYISFTKNPMLKTFRDNYSFLSFISYLLSFFLIIFGSYYQFVFIKKRKKYQVLYEIKNDTSSNQETQEVKIG